MRTHVLVPEDTLVRRRDAVEVIATAVTAKARGSGHRRIAADLGLRFPVSTVREWLRRFALMATRIHELFTRWAFAAPLCQPLSETVHLTETSN